MTFRRYKYIQRSLYDDLTIAAAPYFFLIDYVRYYYDTGILEIYGRDLQAIMEYMNDLNDQIVLINKVFEKKNEKDENRMLTNDDFRKFYQ